MVRVALRASDAAMPMVTPGVRGNVAHPLIEQSSTMYNAALLPMQKPILIMRNLLPLLFVKLRPQ
jgi:hypothetical protein